MTGIIILAAGASTRLGKPKQSLIYQGKTLLQHALAAAAGSTCAPVILVLGANREDVLPDIIHSNVTIIDNPAWATGMSSSIKAGITELQKTPGITGAVIMLCDQPFVDAALIRQLLQAKNNSGKGIAASFYSGATGVPVLFGIEYFPQLLALNGNEGAKKLLAMHADDIAPVIFPKGGIDIDTIEDYEQLTG